MSSGPRAEGPGAPEPAGRPRRWGDPDWLLFAGCALAVPAVHLAAGGTERASFFFGTAAYLSCLKWIGWICLGPPAPGALALARWPAELFCGLAVTAAWFYARNLLAWLWPASYGLVELRLLFWVLLAGHAVLAWRDGRLRPPADALSRSAAWAPFFLLVAVVFHDVSASLQPQSTDPMYHAFTVKVFGEHGVWLPHFLGGNRVPDQSGMGALGAAAGALGGLGPVQVVNLLPGLWIAAALFALAGAGEVLAGERLRALPWLPPIFLLLFPVHNLPPLHWGEGAPRQLLPALCFAALLLPVLVPPGRRAALVGGALAGGMLCGLAMALSPVGAPYAAAGWAAGTAASLALARKAGTCPSACAGLLIHAGAALLCGFLVLGCDALYQDLLVPRAPASAGRTEGRPSFVLAAGLSRFLGEPLLGMAEDLEFLGAVSADVLPRSAALLMAAALALFGWSRRRPGSFRPRIPLLAAMAACAALWILSKTLAHAVAGAMAGSTGTWSLVPRYVLFLQVRTEHFIALSGGTSAALFIFLALRDGWGRRALLPAAALGSILLAGAAGLALLRLPSARPAGPILPRAGFMGKVGREDLELVRWIDRHLGPERGLVGLMARPFRNGEEKHLFPFGGAQALPLYGRRLNFTFFQLDPWRAEPYDDYVRRVQYRLDVRWCLENGIRHFYVDREFLGDNPGLAEAIDSGVLIPVEVRGGSAVYAVSAGR